MCDVDHLVDLAHARFDPGVPKRSPILERRRIAWRRSHTPHELNPMIGVLAESAHERLDIDGAADEDRLARPDRKHDFEQPAPEGKQHGLHQRHEKKDRPRVRPGEKCCSEGDESHLHEERREQQRLVPPGDTRIVEAAQRHREQQRDGGQQDVLHVEGELFGRKNRARDLEVDVPADEHSEREAACGDEKIARGKQDQPQIPLDGVRSDHSPSAPSNTALRRRSELASRE